MEQSKIRNLKSERLSDGWARLDKWTFDYLDSQNQWEHQDREVLDRGHTATVLLYNQKKKTLVLTRQLRIAAHVGGHPDGMLIETCAGSVRKNEDPEACMLREIEEETGFNVPVVKKVLEAYPSPGALTELVHFFTAAYTDEMRLSEGGGAKDEQEDIEVLEIPFDNALQMIADGRIKDAKTIMLVYYAKIHHLLE